MKNTRTPAELLELFNTYEKEDNFEGYIDQLSFEELTLAMMTAELVLDLKDHYKMSDTAVIMYQNFLEYVGKKRKEFLEKN